MNHAIRIVFGLIIASVLLLIAAHMLRPAWAHSWYDTSCCSNRDCEPIPPDAVNETATGYEVNYFSKQGFPVHGFMPREKARHSQDGRFHGCATSTRFLCLYVPSVS
jgi:hypothetical protein